MVFTKIKKSYNLCFPCFFYYFTLNIMPTIQLVRSARQKMTNKTKAPALKSCPQRRGVCTRVYTQTPKTKLSFTKVACTSNNRVCRNCLYSRNWPQFTRTLGCLSYRVKDLPGVRYISFEGLDTAGVKSIKSRSKYGVKLPKTK
jgi:small subunit ribosomal protein S12